MMKSHDIQELIPQGSGGMHSAANSCIAAIAGSFVDHGDVKVLGAIFSGLERVHGGHHDYVDKYNMGNISNYRGGNVLIDRILAR